MMTPIYYVYILLCENGSYYTGYTHNLKKRFELHVAGKASKYTRSFKPVEIVQSWQFADMGLAKKVEARIKKLSRGEKEGLILSPGLIGGMID